MPLLRQGLHALLIVVAGLIFICIALGAFQNGKESSLIRQHEPETRTLRQIWKIPSW